MKDWLFFPVIATIAGAMIYVAMYWGGGPEPVNPEEGFVVKGTELQYLLAPEGTYSKLKGLDYAVMGANVRAEDIPSPGVHTVLNPIYAKAYQGRNLELKVRVRAGAEKPADKFQIAFLTDPPVKGRFGWREFPVGPDFEDITIKVQLAEFDVEQPIIYFGIWPDAEGKGRTIEVERYQVMPID